MCNMDIREYAAKRGVRLWQISYRLGIKSEGNFSRKLRNELPKEEKERIFAIIDDLAKEVS